MKKLFITAALLGAAACTPQDRIASFAIAGEAASQRICVERGTQDSLLVRTVRRDLRARFDIENDDIRPELADLLSRARLAADAACGPVPSIVMPHPMQ